MLLLFHSPHTFQVFIYLIKVKLVRVEVVAEPVLCLFVLGVLAILQYLKNVMVAEYTPAVFRWAGKRAPSIQTARPENSSS